MSEPVNKLCVCGNKTNRKFCSRSCANKGNAKRNSESKKGEKNPMFGMKPHNYKGFSESAKSGSRKVFYRLIPLNGKQVREHRLIIETFLGRKLESHEVVHHVDGNGLNNDISNLRMMTKSEHSKLHSKEIRRDSRGRLTNL